MVSLTFSQRDLLLIVLSKKRTIQNGYYVYCYKGKRYPEHRLLLELILNKKLKSSDAVHHKDHDKLNNDFQNLKIIGNSEHISLHHAGSKKVGNFKPHNKLTEEKKIKITELSKKILKSNGKPHCSKIGEMLGISGFTVSRYI